MPWWIPSIEKINVWPPPPGVTNMNAATVGIKTINEARADVGLPPLEVPEISATIPLSGGSYKLRDEENHSVQYYRRTASGGFWPVTRSEWIGWFATPIGFEDRKIAEDFIGEFRISTVFVGNDIDGRGWLWESIVFDGYGSSREEYRYDSESAARAGHANLVVIYQGGASHPLHPLHQSALHEQAVSGIQAAALLEKPRDPEKPLSILTGKRKIKFDSDAEQTPQSDDHV